MTKPGRDKVDHEKEIGAERGSKEKNAEEMEAKRGPKAETAEEEGAEREAKAEVKEMGESWEPETERIDQREKEQGKQRWQEEEMLEQDSNHTERKAGKRSKRKAEFAYEDIEIDKKHRKTEYRIAGTMTAKVFAFFLLVISCFVGLCGGCTIVCMRQAGMYTSSQSEILQTVLYNEAKGIVYRVKDNLEAGNVENAEAICQEHNIDLELIKEEDGKETVVWSTGNDYDISLKKDMITYFSDTVAIRNIVLNDHVLKSNEAYLFRIYVDTEFSKEDNLKRVAELVLFLYQARFQLIGFTVGCLFLCFVCFVFLMCSAGHRAGYREIVPGVLTKIHLDILTVFFGGVSLFVMRLINEIGYRWDANLLYVLLVIILLTFLVSWVVLFLMDIAVRFKIGKMMRHTLVFEILCWLGRGIRFLGKGLLLLSSHISSVVMTMGICLGICFFEFLVMIMIADGSGDIALFLWAMEKLILLTAAVYITFNYKQLLQAGDALAEGWEDYVVDTSKMVGDFRRHGENLNSIGRGISKAVAERMKSEHLKTELITNVSHDLKTPLTSIINYADLICEEAANPSGEEASSVDHSRVAEYAEVLLRQSRRLKKLLEDLVEASKATTGNLEVNLEPCEAGVILSQAMGEYEKRMEEKGLKLITRQPEEPVYIIADGKHLWRVFDNLLNNICKYAQENSRVYLSVETKEEYVMIIFRNMSKYPLELSAEELQERFVRGDKSRHMEGNGLGLSIAGSLIELQNGKMDIVTDGDLFKVVLQLLRDYES